MNKDAELAWAAGFFDGEGCTAIAKATHGNKRTKPRIIISQKYPECLERFKAAIGDIGTIYGPLKHPKRSIAYHFSMQNIKGVDTILNKLWPFLSVHKRTQAERSGFKYGTVRESKLGRPKGSKNRPKENQ